MTDDSGVFLVQVHFKQSTMTAWNDASLHAIDDAGSYEGHIPGAGVTSEAMDDYIEATDGADNVATAPPDDGTDRYYSFTVDAG